MELTAKRYSKQAVQNIILELQNQHHFDKLAQAKSLEEKHKKDLERATQAARIKVLEQAAHALESIARLVMASERY